MYREGVPRAGDSPPLREEIGALLVPSSPGAVERLQVVTLKPILSERAFERWVATVEELLRAGQGVRVVIQPEPRQGSARELSSRMLDRIRARVVPYPAVEESREQDGANWVMVLAPSN